MAMLKECVAWRQQPSGNTEENTKCIPPHLLQQLVCKAGRTQGCKDLGDCATQDLPAAGTGNGGVTPESSPSSLKQKSGVVRKHTACILFVHFSMGEMNIIVTGIFISVLYAIKSENSLDDPQG